MVILYAVGCEPHHFYFYPTIYQSKINKPTNYTLGIIINILNVFAKNKFELKWLASFPKYFNTIIKPKEIIQSKPNNFFKGQTEIN